MIIECIGILAYRFCEGGGVLSPFFYATTLPWCALAVWCVCPTGFRGAGAIVPGLFDLINRPNCGAFGWFWRWTGWCRFGVPLFGGGVRLWGFLVLMVHGGLGSSMSLFCFALSFWPGGLCPRLN